MVGAATTEPIGIYTVRVAGRSVGEAPARTWLGVQLLPAKMFEGLAAQVDESAVTPNNLLETPLGLLPDPERESYLHVLTGEGRGFIAGVREFREYDIVCDDDLTPWLGPGGRFLVRPHPHLADLFGADNRFGLQAAEDAGDADNVVVHDAALQKERIFYYHSTRGRWEEKGIEEDAGHTPLRFPHGFFIVRRATSSLRIALSGSIGSDPVLLPVRPGANVFSLPVHLSASLENWIATEGPFAVMGGRNATRADLLIFEEPFTGARRGPFYFLPQAGEWREVGVNGSSAPLEPLDMLSTLVLRRHGPPGYIRVEGSLEATGLVSPSPPDPEPGELPLSAEMPLPANFPPGVNVVLQTSTDLQTWTAMDFPPREDGRIIFTLPPGESRAFYRLDVTLAP